MIFLCHREGARTTEGKVRVREKIKPFAVKGLGSSYVKCLGLLVIGEAPPAGNEPVD